MARLHEAGAAVIISFHDFKKTGDLEAVHRRMETFAPEIMKVVPTARKLADNLTLMRFLEHAADRSSAQIVGMCMGDAGVISRVLGIRAGSAFIFAAPNAGEETAPGQIAARTLLESYRIDAVDAATRVFGVAGDPIGSSLSPLMMNTAFRRETVNAIYLALQTGDAEDLFKLAREIPIGGLSITMPLKQAVLPLLERTDPLSAKIGAVNTVLRAQDGKFYGFNTDVAGIVGPLERRLSLRDARVLVLGAGGAARAAVFGCRDKGAEVSILNRTPEAAQKLAKQAGAKVIRRDALAKSTFDVIINATPAGMAGNSTTMPLNPEELNARLVFDLVYNPLETPLLRAAKAKGLGVISGVEMFVQQGARQFEIWTGKPAPEDEMLRVVLHALRQGSETQNETPAAGHESASGAPPTPADTSRRTDTADREPAATRPRHNPAAPTEYHDRDRQTAHPAPAKAKTGGSKAPSPADHSGRAPAKSTGSSGARGSGAVVKTTVKTVPVKAAASKHATTPAKAKPKAGRHH